MSVPTRMKALCRLSCAILIAGIGLWPATGAAQGTPSKAQYRKIFSEVLSKFLAEKPENVCLPSIHLGSGPSGTVEISQKQLDASATAPTGQAAQFKALEAAGLLSSVASERMVKDKAESFRTFRRTEKGDRHYSAGRLCYARAELNRIVKWKGPAVFGEYKIVWIYYTTRIASVADWAQTPDVLAAFPAIKSNLQDDPDKVRQALIDLSSEGWEVNEWSRVLQ